MSSSGAERSHRLCFDDDDSEVGGGVCSLDMKLHLLLLVTVLELMGVVVVVVCTSMV